MCKFFIEKFVTTCAGSPVTDIRKTAGGLLIRSLIDQQEARLLILKKIGKIEVKVHATTPQRERWCAATN